MPALAAGPTDSNTGLVEGPGPVRGGRLVVSVAAEPPGLDPTISTSSEINRVLYGNVFEGLVMVGASGRIEPGVASRWEISEDGKTYRFFLREARFHNGQPVTSHDVKARLDRARDPNANHTNKAYYKSITAVEAPDPHTVVIRLSEPDGDLLVNLARPDSVIYPSGWEEQLASQPVGTGPFAFQEWVPGSHITLQRFADYWNPELPYLDSVVFRFISDPNTQLSALLSGDIDVIGYGLSPENALVLEADRRFKVIAGSTTTEVVLALNNSRKPFDDIRVRRAINHAVDRDAIIDLAQFGFGTPIASPLNPGEQYYIDLNHYFPHDPDLARELLAEAGFPNGFSVTFSVPQPYLYAVRSAEVIADQLAQVNIDVKLETVEWTQWLSRIFGNAEYDMTIIGHSQPFDIDRHADPNFYLRYDGPVLQDLVAKARRSHDESERTALYAAIQEEFAKEAVSAYLFNLTNIVGARDNVYGLWINQPTVTVNVARAYKR